MLLMKAFIRRIGVYGWHTTICVAVLASLLTVLWAVSYSISVHQRRQAERLLQQVAGLQSGTPNLSTLHQITREPGVKEHCTPDSCSYDFSYGFGFSDSLLSRIFHRTEWDYVGLRPWQVAVHLEVKNGQLSDFESRTVVARGRGWLFNEGLFSGNMWAWLMTSIRSNSEAFEQHVRREGEYDQQQAVNTGHQIVRGSDGLIVGKPNVDTPGSGEGLTVELSPTAPAESRRIAFDVNLRCTTSMSPCTELCQLAPSAWQSYSAVQKSNGWWVDEPIECGPATRQ
jgi:hypothetical protein